jgi:hypothetical protein
MRKLAQLLFPLCHSRIHIRCIELQSLPWACLVLSTMLPAMTYITWSIPWLADAL